MSEVTLNRMVCKWRKEGDSPGVVALKALDYSKSDSLDPPQWAIDQVVECWQHFTDGTPVVGWEGDIENDLRHGNVPASLGAAFGVADRKKPDAKRNARMHWYGPRILDVLASQELPASDEGFSAVGISLGITQSQARDWYYQYRDFINSPPP